MKASSWRWTYLAAGLALRAGLLLWGEYQDRTQTVPYTDVDYLVFSDAAFFVTQGCPLSKTVESSEYETDDDILERDDVHCARGFLPAAARFLLLNDPINHSDNDDSPFRSSSPLFRWASWCYGIARPVFRLLASLGDPYARSTYRYTPFLAAALAPIHLLGWTNFGKHLFAAADVFCAILMWLILDGRRPQGSTPGIYVHLPGLLWLLNPIPAQISTRGSSEAFVGVSVLLFLYFFLKTNPEAPLGLKPVYERSTGSDSAANKEGAHLGDAVPTYQPLLPEVALPVLDWSIEAFLAPIAHGFATHLKIFPVIYSVPILSHLYTSTVAAYEPSNRRKLPFWSKHAAGIQFGLVSFVSFMSFNAVAYALWGSPFIEHTFLYHIKRVDHRHNFSPYFFSSYLSSYASINSDEPSVAGWGTGVLNSTLLSFAPQMFAVTLLGYELGKRDMVAAMTAQTITFVAFNKVCTSQYFLWFLWLLPLVGPTLQASRYETAIAATAWIGAQALWLSQAYQLEFEARQVFARIWASGLVLLIVHASLLGWFISAWTRHRLRFSKHRLVINDGSMVKTAKTQ